MKFLVAFLLVATSITLKAQTLVVDPVVASLTVAGNAVENNSYNKIKDKQNAIEVLQTTTVSIVAFLNDWHKKFYNGLQQVSGTLKNAYQIVECAEILKDIYNIESEMMTAAKPNPLALTFVIKVQKDMVVKAVTYYTDIKNLILKENDDKLLMDAGQRADLLNNVRDNLRSLRALAWHSLAKVKQVIFLGIFNAINPFNGVVNRDALIVNDILKSWKY